jgi:hypothetical protein
VIAALELRRRARRAAQVVVYLAASIPIAILGVLAVLLLAVGAALSVLRVGLPVLRGAAAGCRRLVGIDRRLANRFLGTRVPALAAGRAARWTCSPTARCGARSPCWRSSRR